MISVVVPVFNEADSLATLHAELDRVCAAAGLDAVEFVFVDDGSQDDSWAAIRGWRRAMRVCGASAFGATSARRPP